MQGQKKTILSTQQVIPSEFEEKGYNPIHMGVWLYTDCLLVILNQTGGVGSIIRGCVMEAGPENENEDRIYEMDVLFGSTEIEFYELAVRRMLATIYEQNKLDSKVKVMVNISLQINHSCFDQMSCYKSLETAMSKILPQLINIDELEKQRGNILSHHLQSFEEDEKDQQYLNQSEGEPEQQREPVSDDPLDAFMNDLENQKQEPSHKDNQIMEEDQQQGVQRVNQRHFAQILDAGEDDDIPSATHEKKIIQPLQPFDFSTVVLENFEKNFYKQHEQISAMTSETAKKFMKQFEIKVSGEKTSLKPVVSFGHLPFPPRILRIISDKQYEKPTPIQSQALPYVLSGRDVVGIAKTGSGKTLAYVWPMIIHVLHQRTAKKGEGPIALILAPTRQLCQQIYIETKQFTKKEDIRLECLLGGENKHQQWKKLKAGCDILIATPGRLMQFLKKKATNLIRVTYLVLDEADRMLSLGFQIQIRSIVAQTREDRQTLLFTATMKKSIELLAADVVNWPVRITAGDQSSANEDIVQEVIVVKDDEEKWEWLSKHIGHLKREGKMLIFANQKQQTEDLSSEIQNSFQIQCLSLHGDKAQYERTSIMNSFKKDAQVLIATDIASRGIDVKNIQTVINYASPKNIETYIHRIGRAGRAGQMGKAYTFLTEKDVKLAVSLVKVFENSGYPVPDQLEDLSMLDEGFKRKRISAKMGVSFAKGNDASKFLNQAIKKQRKGFSRAGLGHEKGKEGSQSQLSLSNEVKTNEMSISEISSLIKNKIQDKQRRQVLGGNFILSSTNDHNNQTITQTTVVFGKSKKK